MDYCHLQLITVMGMKQPRIGLFIGCLAILVLGVQGIMVEPAWAKTPPVLNWHVSPGQEFVHLYHYTSTQVGNVQSFYLKYRIGEINNTGFTAGSETYYRDTIWVNLFTWTGNSWQDVTSGQLVPLTTTNHTWQIFNLFIMGNYYEVTGYPRGYLETNTSSWMQPEGIFLPEMPYGSGLYNMSQFNQSYFISSDAQIPGNFEPEHSSLSETDNWWSYDDGTYVFTRKWTHNGVLLEWTRKMAGVFESNYCLIDAPGYHREYWTAPTGLAVSCQWGGYP